MANEPVVCFSTASSPEEGEKIARTLVEEQLAACVNLFPGVRSIYRWQGQIEDGTEIFLVIKTQRHLVDSVISRIRKLHSYAVPEIIALPIVAGSPDYLAWLADSTSKPRGG
jgi:periplasmic divalent cation tolerance protein